MLYSRRKAIGTCMKLLGAACLSPIITPRPAAAGQLLGPKDLVYQGAFRLPDGPDEIAWQWSGGGLTVNPAGNHGAGSLFGFGHAWNYYVSEVSIPSPVISKRKKPQDLPTARTIQKFADISGRPGRPGQSYDLKVGGLEYCVTPGGDKAGKLHFAWGIHSDYHRVPTHGWADTNLSAPRTAGLWHVGNHFNSHISTNDYLFTIDPAWAAAHTPGMLLATGRYREGGLVGEGPTLYAYGPWNQGNPPRPGTVIQDVTLLRYGEFGSGKSMNGYRHSDEWSGGAWLSQGSRAAVVFVGTKALGKAWYGYRDGTTHESCQPNCPDSLGPRGWWASSTQGQIIFFNPRDLAAVAAGRKAPHEPQPFAVLDLTPYLFRKGAANDLSRLGAAAFDRVRSVLYVMERRADDDKPVIHVWRIT